MKYFYFQSEKGNFGDDLNPWLWGQLFDEDKNNEDNILLGIGTVLFNDFDLIKAIPVNQKKIVFGSGVRAGYGQFKIDSSWDIKFLRGPLSSSTFNNKYKYISDAAYAMRSLNGFESFKHLPKKYEVGFMPYFRSMDLFDWQKICSELGFHLISPYAENGVEFVINELASSKMIITEAMHGAIVADILRVPWSRYVLTTPQTEGVMISEFKWMDWQHSIELGGTETTVIKYYKKTKLNHYIKKFSFETIDSQLMIKGLVNRDIIRKLSSITNFYLSKDSIVNEIDEKIGEEIVSLRTFLDKPTKL